MSGGKIVLLGAWLACASGFAIPADPTAAVGATTVMLAGWARFAFWLMLAAHLIEFSLFSSKLKQAPGSLAAHFFLTLVFGLLHIRGIAPAEQEGESA